MRPATLFGELPPSLLFGKLERELSIGKFADFAPRRATGSN